MPTQGFIWVAVRWRIQRRHWRIQRRRWRFSGGGVGGGGGGVVSLYFTIIVRSLINGEDILILILFSYLCGHFANIIILSEIYEIKFRWEMVLFAWYKGVIWKTATINWMEEKVWSGQNLLTSPVSYARVLWHEGNSGEQRYSFWVWVRLISYRRYTRKGSIVWLSRGKAYLTSVPRGK